MGKKSKKSSKKKVAVKKPKKSSKKKTAVKKSKKSSKKKVAVKKPKKSSKKKTAVKKSKKSSKKKVAVKKSKKSSKKKVAVKKPKKSILKKAVVKKPAKVRVPVKLALREKELQDILEKENESKMILKDMMGRDYCLVESCDSPSIVEGYCRLHYFAGWKVILQRKKMLEEGFLEKIFFRLLEKYSGAILEYMFKDLSSEKSFLSVSKKLEDSGDFDIEDENLLNLLEE